MKRCLFCNAEPQKWSEEHVIPQWLWDHLGVSPQDQMYQGFSGGPDDVPVSPRIHASRRLVEGRVCSDCNNGWMNRLEDAARPILKPLVSGERALYELYPSDAVVVAKWIAKCAYTLASVSIAKKPVPALHLRQLAGDAGTLPAGVSVFGWQAGRHDQVVSYIQTMAWPEVLAPHISATSAADWPDAYKIAFQINHLNLLVAYMPLSQSIVIPVAGLHVPLWPTRFMWPAYQSDRLGPLSGSLPALKSFADSLAFMKPDAVNASGGVA